MNVPKLRFKEFSGEWEIGRLGELFSKRKTKGVKGLPTYSVTLNDGMKNRESLDRETVTNLSVEEHLLVKKNDLAYNMMRMWQGAFGLAPTDGLVSPAYVVLTPVAEKAISQFFEYYFKRGRQIHNFWAYSQGLTEDRLRLYFDDFKMIRNPFPSLKEQTKIASFLTAIDEKIAQLTQKHALLNQYKKGMMQQIFSQALRFKDDEGREFEDWNGGKLEEICIKKSSKISANQITENTGKYPIYGATGYLKDVDFYIQEEGYIAIVKDGAGVGRLQLLPKKTSVLSTLEIIIPSNQILLDFLFYLLAQVDFSSFVKGSTIPHVYFKDYGKSEIKLPSLPEQTKIANFLSSIDQKIDQVAAQLDATKQYKRGLLQQMFV